MNMIIRLVIFLFVGLPSIVLANNPIDLIKPLPITISNHVSVIAKYEGKNAIFVFGGMTKQDDRHVMTNKAWRWKLNLDKQNSWQALSPMPSNKQSSGHIASSAIAIDQNIYLFTGFTNSKPDKRMKTSETYRYHIDSDQYNLLTEMPMSVADAVAVSYRDRYIYLIGGWHQDGAVNTVQVFDTLKNEWSFASPLINHNNFGAAGAILDNTILLCDGATSTAQPFSQSRVKLKPRCYLGVIDVINPFKISWTQWQHPTDVARYKMVAGANTSLDEFIFVGGSNVFHDYSGKSAQPISEQDSQGMWIYNLTKNSWRVVDQPQNTYDHNSLLFIDNHWVTLAGMNKNGDLLNTISLYYTNSVTTNKTN